MSDESMWSEMDGLFGIAMEEAEEPYTKDNPGVLHPMPDFENGTDIHAGTDLLDAE